MKMKNKVLALLLMTTLCLSLVACTSQEESNSSTSSSEEVTTEITDDSIADNATEISIATEEDVIAALASDSAVVLDARQQEVYSGWSIYDNQGGHIDGAANFAANWLDCTYDDDSNLDGLTRLEQLQRKLEDKGITTETEVIVYDNSGADSAVVAEFLLEQGITNVKTFALNEWTGELVTYENYELYVPPVVVDGLINGIIYDDLEDFSDPIILEVSWGTTDVSTYSSGHVPGAIHVNSDDFDDVERAYLLETDETLFTLAESLGITTDSQVIVTGDPIFSCRYAIILKYLGCEDVYVMSGGTDGWSDAGFELETTENLPTAVEDFGTSTPANPDYIDTVDEAVEILASDDSLLIDNRTIEEYNGETSGYSYFDLAGRIEGAVFGYAGIDNSSSMIYYRNPDVTMRDEDEIEAMWEDAGVDTDMHLSFFCGGGYRAAEILWDAWVMGYEDTSLFADGWIGWASEGMDYIVGE